MFQLTFVESLKRLRRTLGLDRTQFKNHCSSPFRNKYFAGLKVLGCVMPSVGNNNWWFARFVAFFVVNGKLPLLFVTLPRLNLLSGQKSYEFFIAFQTHNPVVSDLQILYRIFFFVLDTHGNILKFATMQIKRKSPTCLVRWHIAESGNEIAL